MPIFVAFAGLAVDVSYAFMLKSALVTATDSPALAGSRAIPDLDRIRGRRAEPWTAPLNPTCRPTSCPRASRLVQLPTVTIEGNGSRSISSWGRAVRHTSSCACRGINSFTVKAYAKGVRRDVKSVMLVLTVPVR